jgi:hypothetical protein
VDRDHAQQVELLGEHFVVALHIDAEDLERLDVGAATCRDLGTPP